MSLREEAIAAYEEVVGAEKQEREKEHQQRIDRYMQKASEMIVRDFDLVEAPELSIEGADQYYPTFVFELFGMTFKKHTRFPGETHVLCAICHECSGEEWGSFYVNRVNGKPNYRVAIGRALKSAESNHKCPRTAPDPPLPPITVQYTIGCAEVRFLEALDELVFDIVEKHQN